VAKGVACPDGTLLPDVHVFIHGGTCEDVCVVEVGGRFTSVVPKLTVQGMVQHSADTSLQAMFANLLAITRRDILMLARSAAAASAVVVTAVGGGSFRT
jgi:hypothetical protein